MIRQRARSSNDWMKQEKQRREKIRFTLYASRIANLLNENILLAPIGAAVIPLPHQIRALRKATSQYRIRCLLADEVGLGKTIEAGLIMRELKLRGSGAHDWSSRPRVLSRNGWRDADAFRRRVSLLFAPDFTLTDASHQAKTCGAHTIRSFARSTR